jgi:two-component system, NarL family, response regulator LiaR
MIQKIKICIVEDNINIRESLKFLIDSSGECQCIGDFGTAEDAIREVPKLKPNIVLMDIDLPQMNGIECIKHLKPLCNRIQFMICTVYDEDEKIFEALAVGACSYILKRSHQDILIDAIKDLYQGGSPMSSDIARKVVKYFQKRSVIQKEYHLSDREKEILELLSKGLSYQQVADSVCLSSKTIKKHVYNIYDKLQVHSRTEAINLYFGKYQ